MPERSATARRASLGLLLTLLVASPVALAQDEPREVPPDIQRMVRDGMASALEARLRGSRKPEDLHLLAQAYANQAAQLRDATQRQHAFEEAQHRYQDWIAALEHTFWSEPAKRDVDVAAARVELAGVILSKWAARKLDEFELTAGRRGDREQLASLLQTAREEYDRALALIEPLAAALDPREDEFFALGIYDAIRRLQLDTNFNLGWTALYQGVVAPEESRRRAEMLRLAERKFQDLLGSGRVGEMGPRCHLGLAMAQRGQQRYTEAERNFRAALPEGIDAAPAAQVRYELARCQIESRKFEEARITLRPLLEEDEAKPSPQEDPAHFYVNLARIWEANSYLIEADMLRRSAENSPALKAIRLRARRVSDTGLGKMNTLAARGGAWPALVQLYVEAHIQTTADPKTQSPLELLFAARFHAEHKRHRQAEQSLEEALTRKDLSTGLIGQLLFELGTCRYHRRDLPAAAGTFERLASECKTDAKAPQAAIFAYQLRAQIAEESKRPQDYRRLADTLLTLLRNYPQQAKQVEAAWWLPVALQAAGGYDEAAQQFAKVPAASRHWEEAQYRRQLCQRLACEAARGSLGQQEYLARARLVASELTGYARQAYERAPSAPDAEQVRHWSAAGVVNAAEMLVSAGLEQYEQALELTDSFEQRYADSDLLGRVLAVRIRARHGLRQFDQAANLLEQYLQAVPAEKAGGVLAGLAQGMQEEVERLREQGQDEAARSLAGAAVTTFEQLDRWCRGGLEHPTGKMPAPPPENIAAVSYGLARMYYVAGRLDEAARVAGDLLEKDPRNGNCRRLHALILDAQLGGSPSADRIRHAKDAWAALLKDPTLRARAPEHYWEARYHWLALLLREGHAADVAKAIQQDRVWNPNLGGPPWQEKLEALHQQAAEQAP
jgi:TolA-binding protein